MTIFLKDRPTNVNIFKRGSKRQDRRLVLDRLDLGVYSILTDQMILTIILLRFSFTTFLFVKALSGFSHLNCTSLKLPT